MYAWGDTSGFNDVIQVQSHVHFTHITNMESVKDLKLALDDLSQQHPLLANYFTPSRLGLIVIGSYTCTNLKPLATRALCFTLGSLYGLAYS